MFFRQRQLPFRGPTLHPLDNSIAMGSIPSINQLHGFHSFNVTCARSFHPVSFFESLMSRLSNLPILAAGDLISSMPYGAHRLFANTNSIRMWKCSTQ